MGLKASHRKGLVPGGPQSKQVLKKWGQESERLAQETYDLHPRDSSWGSTVGQTAREAEETQDRFSSAQQQQRELG